MLLVPRVPHATSTESTAGDAVPSARDCAAGKGRYFPGFVSLICAYLDFIKCESAATAPVRFPNNSSIRARTGLPHACNCRPHRRRDSPPTSAPRLADRIPRALEPQPAGAAWLALAALACEETHEKVKMYLNFLVKRASGAPGGR